MTQIYVVLRPKTPGNTTDKYLIVDTIEYVDVTRHGKTTYDFVSEHDDYDSANLERNRLNQKDSPWTHLTTSKPSPPTPTTETTSAPGRPEEATPTVHPSTATWKPNLVKSTAPST